jgi:diguanylate cyclase (GGDEF)-like protein
LLYEAYDDGLRCTYAVGERVAYFGGTVLARDDPASPAARALRAGHRSMLREPGACALHPTDAAVVAVPLEREASQAAVVALVATAALDADAENRIVLLAELAAPSFLIARDRERDRRTAEYDGLTGLLTPRAFRRRLAALVERARASPAAALALMFVDTDNFKRWNDTFGHAAGDELLRRIAAELRGASRERDLAARNGGDEFCLILADTAKAAAIDRAAMLRARIAAIDARISASIGVAAYPADGTSAGELLERADAAMYHAKATGRDGVAYRDAHGALVRLRDEASS